MNTKSIEEYIYSLENPKDCKELTINKLSITGEIQTVDLNDLYNFSILSTFLEKNRYKAITKIIIT